MAENRARFASFYVVADMAHRKVVHVPKGDVESGEVDLQVEMGPVDRRVIRRGQPLLRLQAGAPFTPEHTGNGHARKMAAETAAGNAVTRLCIRIRHFLTSTLEVAENWVESPPITRSRHASVAPNRTSTGVFIRPIFRLVFRAVDMSRLSDQDRDAPRSLSTRPCASAPSEVIRAMVWRTFHICCMDYDR